MTPIATFALLARNQAAYLPEALDSLLNQTRSDRGIVVVDNGSSDTTPEIIADYKARFPELVTYRHEGPLNAAASWNFGFRFATEAFPEAPYFAWATDHDIWETGWLAALTEVLDDEPDAVLVYPATRRITEDGVPIPDRSSDSTKRFNTLGMGNPEARLLATVLGARGEAVYGLYRVSSLRQTELWRPVLFPDRLFLAELALKGEFVELEAFLWNRRKTDTGRLRRQRRHLFVRDLPFTARLPWWLVHSLAIARARFRHPGKNAGTRMIAALFLGYVCAILGVFRGTHSRWLLLHQRWMRWRKPHHKAQSGIEQ